MTDFEAGYPLANVVMGKDCAQAALRIAQQIRYSLLQSPSDYS
jgi:hypothetical protein